MSKKVSKNDLGFLGEEYQKELVKCFIEDQQFFLSIYTIIDQNMFTNEHLRRIVGFMKDRVMTTESVPTYTDLKIIIRSKVSDTVNAELAVAVLREIFDMKMSAIDIIEGECEKFFKQQNLIKTMRKAEDIVKNGDYNRYPEIAEMFQKTLEVNNKQDMGFRLFECLDNDLSEEYRITVPTGASKLDEALYGGLGKGELGVIVCPLGVGKTSSTTGFAAYASTYRCQENNFKGFKVLHLFFEDNEVSIRRKYYGFATDFDAVTLSDPNIRPLVIEKLNEDPGLKQMLHDNIVCMRLETGEKSASDIEQIINRQIACGFKPDLVIVDYFECLKAESKGDYHDSEWSREGVTMRKLEKITNKYNVAMWVPVQGTKDSIGAEYVGVMHAGGSVKKTQIGHVIITLAQTDEQKVTGTVNLFLGKFRAGRIIRNKFFGIKFNNGTCKFDFSGMDESGALENDADFQSKSNSIAKNIRNEQRKSTGK